MAPNKRGNLWMNAVGILVLAMAVVLVIAMVTIWNT